ncbi:Predicted Co/Zn/Cd cation transporter, cation efflux family [Aquisalimonas asiatica]|uniref:Predicted Co/Zn/Cd cation transporter, cation efflux family n=2 Tax=Aquisalimonas asiatica TaxID=406100 RepID=A0A1H8TEG1_9GAMM|nr:Predicted Co/Zn/Cd cation transporter, cation efflux family [Aquisalimonas asiatica]
MARREKRSLIVAMVGSVVMGVAGVAAGLLGNSAAIMLDGLFSAIAFIFAFLGLRISQRLNNSPDNVRPMGYAAEESLFATFRSLTIIGLIIFAAGSAAISIHAYFVYGEDSGLVFGPILIYFFFIGVLCAFLWVFHYRHWVLSGRRSDILRLEAKAVAFDGLITGIVALGFVGVYFFQNGFIAPVVPVADSLIVLTLCIVFVGQFWNDLKVGIGELVGASAQPREVAAARRAARPVLRESGGCAQDFTVIKMGRTHVVTVYYNPMSKVLASEVDALRDKLTQAIQNALEGAEVFLLVSERSRAG